MGGTADPGPWLVVVAACLVFAPEVAHAGEPLELGSVPPSALARARTIAVHDELRVESIEAEIEGLPLRRPIGRVLVDDTTDEIVASVSHGDVPPWRGSIVLSEAEALRIVEDSGLPGSKGATEATLVADPRPSGTVAVWLVDPPLDMHTLSNPLFAVDAETGELQRLYDQATSVRLEAYYRNPALDAGPGFFTPVQFQAGSQVLRGPVFQAMNCVPRHANDYCVPEHVAGPTNAAGDFFHAPPDIDDPSAVSAPLDPFAEVSIYYHADKFMAWLRTFGLATLDCQDAGHVATLVANYRFVTSTGGYLPYDNARYTGQCDRLLVFGQGEDVDFAYDGDVVAHEIGHAAVDKINGGVRLLEPRLRQDALVVDAGALNEAFADFFAEAFTGNPRLGEYIGTYNGGGGAIRNAANTFTCPQSFGGEVHQDSEAFAGALWEGRQLWGNQMVRVVIGTIALLPEDASMEQASAAMVKVARWRLGDVAATKMESIFEKRGLLECRRIVDIDEVRGSIEVQPPEWAVPYAPPPLQVHVEVPAGSASMRVQWDAEIDGTVEEGSGIRPGVLVKYNQPFAYQYDTSHGWPPTLVHGADATYEDASDGEIQIPVMPGTQVYLAFVNGGDAAMRVSDIVVEFGDDAVDTEGPEETDGETDDDTATDSISDSLGPEMPEEDDGSKKGCACSNRPRDAMPAALLLVLLPLLRRRRR